MYFYLIGIDYKRATIDVREALYRQRKSISDFWAGCNPGGSAVLVTCNRMEIYAVAKYPDDAFGHIAAFSGKFPYFSKYAYIKFGETQVFRHALRLGSGLESQLNGEKQILAQLNTWRANSTLPFPLEVLWDKAIFLSKKIRSASGLDKDSGNIAALIFDDIIKRMGLEKKHRIVIIGTGKIAEVFAKHGHSKAHLTFVAHKNHQKAQALAQGSGQETVLLQDLPRIITKADILIGATSSPHYVLKKEHFGKYLTGREYPLYIYDLAVPRDVEPAVSGIDGLYLYNLDSLEHLFDRYNRSIQDRVESASGLIEDALRLGKEAIHEKNN